MGCLKTYSGKRNHGGETARLPPTIEKGVLQGGYQSSGIMVLPTANYFTIVTPALQKNIIFSMGKTHFFRIKVQESIKNDTSRGSEVVQLSPIYIPLHTKSPY